MPPEIYTHYLLWAFAIAFIFGAIANRANFCTMGAVSDWINIGDLNRMRSWMLAIATAIVGVGILEYLGTIDMSLTIDNATSNPPYRNPNFVWPRNLLGGLMFGVGMTLASGCGNKTLVRLGEGNLKSLVVLGVMGIAAWWMLYTNLTYNAFLQWMQPISVDFSRLQIPSQDIAAVVFGAAGMEPGELPGLIVALLASLPLWYWILRSRDFRQSTELLVAGLAIGILIVVAWYVTAGPGGQKLLEEIDFMDQRPFFTGAQSLTFVGPAGHLAQYIKQGLAWIYLTFGVATVAGVTLGSLVYTILFRKVRLEWFASWQDFVAHVGGALLMGIGGVLAMGCTIGQGITGVSTLALGSLVTIVSIITGSALTMKYQYYRMMREPD